MPMFGTTSSDANRSPGLAVARIETGVDVPHVEKPDSFADIDFYSVFLIRVERLLGQSSATPEQMVEALDLHKSQLSVWLQRGGGGTTDEAQQAGALRLEPSRIEPAGAVQRRSLIARRTNLRMRCRGEGDVHLAVASEPSLRSRADLTGQS